MPTMDSKYPIYNQTQHHKPSSTPIPILSLFSTLSLFSIPTSQHLARSRREFFFKFSPRKILQDFKIAFTMWRSVIPRLNALLMGQSRGFATGSRLLNGSVFSEVTQNVSEKKESVVPEKALKDPLVHLKGSQDEKLQEFYKEQQEHLIHSAEKTITPLKRTLYPLNVKKHGFFKNHQVVKDPSGEIYKFSLTADEIDVLEPSIYISTGRLKTSVKKATPVNRFVRGYFVKNAINQLHFNKKKVATELEKLLKFGLKAAEEKGYDQDGLWIERIWAGSDGQTRKLMDIKGRGRQGKINMRYAHIKVILRTEETLKRLKWEKALKSEAKKPKMMLNNEPLNFRVRPFYKW